MILDEIKKIQEYFDKGKPFDSMPHAHKQASVTVTFVAPSLSAEGIYKMILPAITLNKLSITHKAYIWGIHPFDPWRHIDKFDIEIPEELIAVSDVIVLPMVTYDISPIVEEIHRINKTTTIFYCIDINWLKVPVNYPNHKIYEPNETKDRILENLKLCDGFITTSKLLIEYIDYTFGSDLQGTNILPVFMPIGYLNGITDNLNYDELPEVDPQKIVRLGLICNPTHFDDINCIRNELKTVMDKHGSDIELIAFGWDGTIRQGKGFKDVFKGIPVTKVKAVSFYDYFQTLVDLQLDAVLIPISKKDEFYMSCKNYIKFIECSILHIPVIATKIQPLSDIITHMKTGILIEKKEDWITEIELIIENHKETLEAGLSYRLDELANSSYNYVVSNHPYKRFLPLLEKVFVPKIKKKK